MRGEIHFQPDRQKIIETLVFLAERQPRIDVFHVCKVIYFADKDHFKKYGRPILGDQYFAMDDGPVPSFALNVAKRKEQFVSSHWLRYAKERLSTDESDGYVRLTARTSFDRSIFSRTDIECLTEALKKYGKMEFLKLWRLAHEERAWKQHYAGDGTSTQIPFEDLLSPEERRKASEYLRETSSVTEL
jgi:uncharacterized phage-associated protein